MQISSPGTQLSGGNGSGFGGAVTSGNTDEVDPVGAGGRSGTEDGSTGKGGCGGKGLYGRGLPPGPGQQRRLSQGLSSSPPPPMGISGVQMLTEARLRRVARVENFIFDCGRVFNVIFEFGRMARWVAREKGMELPLAVFIYSFRLSYFAKHFGQNTNKHNDYTASGNRIFY